MRRSTDIETDFPFQEWALLARTSPEAFEARRREVIDRFLGASGRQTGLGLALQREVDAARAGAGDPQAALTIIADMLGQELAFLGDALANLTTSMQSFNAARNALATDPLASSKPGQPARTGELRN